MSGEDAAIPIRGVEAAYDRAWAAGDLDGLMACFTPDVVVVNPRGEVAAGEQAVRRALGSFLEGEAKGSLHRSNLERVAFVGDDVAIVDGQAVISWGSGDPDLRHSFTDVLVRRAGQWAIAHVRAYQFAQHP